jgi:1,6-anhydro-N-acetylmuramate kinase
MPVVIAGERMKPRQAGDIGQRFRPVHHVKDQQQPAVQSPVDLSGGPVVAEQVLESPVAKRRNRPAPSPYR